MPRQMEIEMEVTVKNKGIKIENFTFCRNFPTRETRKIRIAAGYGSYATQKVSIKLSSGQKITLQLTKETDVEVLTNTLETFLNGKYSYPIYAGLLDVWQQDAAETWRNLLPEIFIAVAKKYEQELLLIEQNAGRSPFNTFSAVGYFGQHFFFYCEKGEIYMGVGGLNADEFNRLNPFEVYLKVRKNEIVETEVKEYLRCEFWNADIETQYKAVDTFILNSIKESFETIRSRNKNPLI